LKKAQSLRKRGRLMMVFSGDMQCPQQSTC
jgi:hypothetical protein